MKIQFDHIGMSDVYKQLGLASDAVEYISWITASILAVIAVLTIFLTHLFQNHTLEIRRLNEKIRDKIEQKNLAEVEHLLTDIEFVGKVHPVIEQSVKISKVALRVLIPIWIIAGFAVAEGLRKANEPFPLIGVLLISAGTGLFVYFALHLIEIISKLEKDDDIDKYITQKKELYDVESLKNKNFSSTSIFEISKLKFSLQFLTDDPFIYLDTSSEIPLTNFSILLDLKVNNRKHFYIGEKLTGVQTKQREWKLPERLCRSLRSQIQDASNQQIDCYISFIVDKYIYSYETSLQLENEDYIQTLTIEIENLAGKASYTLPKNVQEQLVSNEEIFQG